ncbi:uracil-DNA glycosylase [Megasphaera sp.]|uniref:uracil-DNA glycosylase n=1 Tax=Megasphaera sp. TaxID=2023260 RepID=UPI0027BAF68A|nr:uracil-DNA glycosylase [Megasphaera sp.]
MKNLIQSLCAYHEPDVFNPWSDYDEQCDISPEAPDIRCRQLQDYLEPRLSRARILLIAEAAGYQGCRFTGIPITCERMLLDEHKQISSAIILGRRGERTSRPDCPFMTSRPQQEKGMNEPTDTYVWGAVVDNGMDPQDVLLWNIFPFHPHKKSPFSNRTPSDTELAAGLSYAKALLSLCRPDIRVAAIGRKSAETLEASGIPAVAMRHPANGGASLFRNQFSRFSL